MHYEDMLAKRAYRMMMEDTNTVVPPTPQANTAPSGTSAPTAPLDTEVNPSGNGVAEEKYSEKNDSEALKTFKKSLVDDIIGGKQISEDVKNIFLSILLKITGEDDDIRVARDSILKGLMDARNELESVFDAVRTSTVI